VLYTHRSLVLHSYGLCMADTFALSERDTVLQLSDVSREWLGVPYAAVMVGSKIVLSGRFLQSADIANLIERERATFTAGVPTLWMGFTVFSKERSTIFRACGHRGGGSALPRNSWSCSSRNTAFDSCWRGV